MIVTTNVTGFLDSLYHIDVSNAYKIRSNAMAKTQRELMTAGEFYDAGDPELSAARHASADLQFEINNLRPSDKETRKELFQKLIGSYGEQFYIRFIAITALIFTLANDSKPILAAQSWM